VKVQALSASHRIAAPDRSFVTAMLACRRPKAASIDSRGRFLILSSADRLFQAPARREKVPPPTCAAWLSTKLWSAAGVVELYVDCSAAFYSRAVAGLCRRFQPPDVSLIEPSIWANRFGSDFPADNL
jgi:hypothetical protein